MGFQAGVYYFDGREIAESEIAAISGWVRAGHGKPWVERLQPGLFMAQSAAHRQVPPHDGCCAGTFDGRLDNRVDLALRLRSVTRAGAADHALALAAYQTRGLAGLADLIGDWSLAVWDATSRAIVLASDFAGVRPLYYAAMPNRIYWSTRLQPLADWLRAADLDDEYVAGLLTFGGCPRRTPFRGIHSTPPGHIVRASREGLRIEPFWKLPIAGQIRYQSEPEYDDHLRTLFREAVRSRLPAGAPCLCELSGGFDSSSVTSMAVEVIRAGETGAQSPVTLSFDHQGSIDRPFYQSVAGFCGLENIQLSTGTHPFLTETDVGGSQPSFWEPLQRRTAAIARNLGATTYMTGQLGDIVMGNWGDDTSQVAGLLRGGQVSAALRQSLAWSKVLRVPAMRILGRAFAEALIPRPVDPARRPDGAPVTDWDTEDSIAPEFRARSGLDCPQNFFSQDWVHARPERRRHLQALTQILELRKLQPPEALEHLDYVHPFAHRPLVTFMLSIPPEVACGPGDPRRLMRRALQCLWPPDLRRRRSKDAFDGVFLDSLRPLARAMLESRRPLEVVERGYVDRANLEKRLQRLTMSLNCNETQLRQIILLEHWLRARRMN